MRDETGRTAPFEDERNLPPEPRGPVLLRFSKTRGPLREVQVDGRSARAVREGGGFLWILQEPETDREALLRVVSDAEFPELASVEVLPAGLSDEETEHEALRIDARKTLERLEERIEEIGKLERAERGELPVGEQQEGEGRCAARRFFLRFDVLTNPTMLRYLERAEDLGVRPGGAVAALLQERPEVKFDPELLNCIAHHLKELILRRAWSALTLQDTHGLDKVAADSHWNYLGVDLPRDVLLLSSYLLKVFGVEGDVGVPQWLEQAFLWFAGGALAFREQNDSGERLLEPDFNAEPDGPLYFALPEFAHAAFQFDHSHRRFWGELFEILVASLDVYLERYSMPSSERRWKSYARRNGLGRAPLTNEQLSAILAHHRSYVARVVRDFEGDGMTPVQASSFRMDEACMWAFRDEEELVHAHVEFHTVLRKMGGFLADMAPTWGLLPERPRSASLADRTLRVLKAAYESKRP